MNIFINILGNIAGVCIPLAFLPQTVNLIKTRNTSGLSIFSYSIYQLGGLIFLIFGIFRHDVAIITCQIITATLNFIIIGIIINNLIKQKNKEKKNV